MTEMTKQHFAALAKALAAVRPEPAWAEYQIWARLCDEIADVCAMFNPRFDKAKFWEACQERDK